MPSAMGIVPTLQYSSTPRLFRPCFSENDFCCSGMECVSCVLCGV
jgi:hypothetical protein